MVKALPEQLIRRGWSIGKGKTYLGKFGNVTAMMAVIRPQSFSAFQNAKWARRR